MAPSLSSANYTIFRDCFSSALLQRISQEPPTRNKSKRGKNHARKTSKDVVTSEDKSDVDELAEFIEYLASEIFESLPEDLQTLSYSHIQADPRLEKRYNDASNFDPSETILPLVPPSVPESLSAYALLPKGTSFPPLLSSSIQDYITATSAPPPAWSTTRASACEICERHWVPLTYHHLIPKQVHEKALKRKWHEEWTLNSVAWLCRACHSYVHSVASNEELAQFYWTVDLLNGREDVQAWAKWVSRVRWKSR